MGCRRGSFSIAGYSQLKHDLFMAQSPSYSLHNNRPLHAVLHNSARVSNRRRLSKQRFSERRLSERRSSRRAGLNMKESSLAKELACIIFIAGSQGPLPNISVVVYCVFQTVIWRKAVEQEAVQQEAILMFKIWRSRYAGAARKVAHFWFQRNPIEHGQISRAPLLWYLPWIRYPLAIHQSPGF